LYYGNAINKQTGTAHFILFYCCSYT